jgi:cytochrome c oxidase subunit I
MGTLLILIVFSLFLTAILTGGYNKTFLQRVKGKNIWEWITTVDHKKIGILYLVTGLVFFLIAGLEAVLIRFQLIVPHNDFLTGDTYNEVITMHGTTMMFLAVLPMFFGLMNFIIPLQIGARDVAFPFLNALGYWLFLVGGIILNLGWIFGGLPDAGWTSYPELALDRYSPGPGIDFYTIGLQISGIGSLISGINFITTIINMRAPGMTFLRMPLFVWTSLITSILILLAFPALTAGLLLLTFDRLFGSHFFDYTLGGSTVIWQHIFWIFGHPEVYILILPAFGVMSEVISAFSKKRLFGYTSMVFATVLIGFLGFMVWVHHMFTVGLGPVSNTIFGLSTMAIAVPTGIKVFNWLFTMWGGEIHFKTPMLFALGFIFSFVIGGVTGVMVAVPAADYQYHDSYFVVAHFHYTLVGGTVLGLFAGIYYWWPKIFGKLLNEKWGKVHFWTFVIGVHLTFFLQHFAGFFGMPRRVFTYNPSKILENINFISTIGALAMTVGIVVFLFNIYKTTKKGTVSPSDPWNGRTLEWSIPSPPPAYNFAQIPLVRGYDSYWLEKTAGDGKMPSVEPLGSSIHMPSPSYLPILMALSLLIAGLGFIFRGNYSAGLIGLIFFFTLMFIRSFQQDHGYNLSIGNRTEEK